MGVDGEAPGIELDPCQSRTVKPKEPAKPSTRPVVALDAAGHVATESSEYLFEYYRDHLHELPPHIMVCFSPETWLYLLHERWHDHPHWSWRVAVTNSHGKQLQAKRVAYYGFRDPQKKHNRYHLILDANSFFRKQDKPAVDLLELGVNVREFCNAHGLELRASAAGIATQLLRHPMFYPHPRRQVPHFINDVAREHLPGGHYEAYATPTQRLTAAHYIDQQAAHHYAAETTPLPNANSVRAIGYAKTSRQDRVYARAGGPLYEREMRKHGLIKALVTVPSIPPDRTKRINDEHVLIRAGGTWLPPLMRHPGEQIAYLWTNELPLLTSMGLQVHHLIATWGTDEVDDGIAKYAQWAQTTQEQYPAMKALLLMPYGLLARHKGTVTYHHPGDGTDTLILANQMLDNTRAKAVPTMPVTANALQLGLIQAFVRALSLDMAQQITAQGHEVLSVYADGIFIRLTKGKPIPLFAPWRVKDECIIELNESLRVPVRRTVRRDYIAARETPVTEVTPNG